MDTSKINQLIEAVDRLVPVFAKDPIEHAQSNGGHAALYIIDSAGQMYGKMYGTDKNRMRNSSRIAWHKATQVWITGLPTGKYEELVFSGKINEDDYGIIRPDFVGWIGGLPAVMADGSKLALAFSGFRGETDCAILRKAVAEVGGKITD